MCQSNAIWPGAPILLSSPYVYIFCLNIVETHFKFFIFKKIWKSGKTRRHHSKSITLSVGTVFAAVRGTVSGIAGSSGSSSGAASLGRPSSNGRLWLCMSSSSSSGRRRSRSCFSASRSATVLQLCGAHCKFKNPINMIETASFEMILIEPEHNRGRGTGRTGTRRRHGRTRRPEARHACAAWAGSVRSTCAHARCASTGARA